VHCTLPIESVAMGVREMLRLGEEVEVLGPPALRSHMAATLSDLAERYRPDDRSLSRDPSP
jgi:hypothetical protein